MTPIDPNSPPHRLRYVARTDRGLMRNTNQDSVFAGERLLVVADGMGGHAAGDTASRLVVDAFQPLNSVAPTDDLLAGLITATRAGNAAIADLVDHNPELDGMGTTLTAMLFDGRRAALSHVGDSRAYLARAGTLHQLTHDDSFVQSLIDEGRITERQAHEHPQRNLLLRALTGAELDPSLAIREVSVGDRYMLCSDGLCGVVDAESIADALAHPNPEIAADTLIQLALVAGGPDNVTVVVADVIATGSDGDADAPIESGSAADDPESTSPIQRLTQEMPRVPLPPIPEEPGAPAELIDDEDREAEDDPEDDPGGDPVGDPDTPARARIAAVGRRRKNSLGRRGKDAPSGPEQAAGDGSRSDGSRSDRNHPDPGNREIAATAASQRESRPRMGIRDSRRRRRLRRSIIAAVVIMVVAGLIAGGTVWVRDQYYVSDQGNLVVVFRGVNGSFLGWNFSTFEETSCAGHTSCTPIKVSDLQPAAQNRVRSGIKASSLREARQVVQRLGDHLLPPCNDAINPVSSDDELTGDAGPGVTCRIVP